LEGNRRERHKLPTATYCYVLLHTVHQDVKKQISMKRWFKDSARGSLKFVEETLLGVSLFSTQIPNKNNKQRRG